MPRTSKPRAKAKPKSLKNKITYGHLRIYNLLAALLLAAQGVLVLILSDPLRGVQPVTTSFLAQDKVSSSIAGSTVYAPASHHLFDINLAYIIAAFFFISALAHLIIATWKRKTYEKDLSRGTNRSRWIEYAFSASTMMLAIALLVGVFDLSSLIMIFALTAVMSLLGLNMELRNQNVARVDWASYSVGLISGLVPWLVLIIYIWNSHVYGSGVPRFVYWIYGSLLVLFASFAVNMYFQYKKLGHWSTYLYGERVYIILSFIAKTALAWQVFAGILR